MTKLEDLTIRHIWEKLNELEDRMQKLEQHAQSTLRPLEKIRNQDKPRPVHAHDQIGEYGLAQIGVIVLLTGMAFLISYPFDFLPSFVASMIGYAAVGGFLTISRIWRHSHTYVANILHFGGLLLAYFATLRLHYFSQNPLIKSDFLGFMITLAVLIAAFYLSVQRGTKIQSFIFSSLIYLTALFSIHAHLTLISLTGAVFLGIAIFIKYDWPWILTSTIFLAYLTHIIWLFNTPVLGNPLQVIDGHYFNLLYLVIYGSALTISHLFNRKYIKTEFEAMTTILSMCGFFLIGALNILIFFKQYTGLLSFLTFVLFITIAILYWISVKDNYSTSYTASFSFIALSASILVQFSSPNYFLWLGLQSLMVIVTAIWFRSRIIILANVLIFLIIYIGYLVTASSDNLVNLSYAVTSLASARILNWKRDRLNLKTDFIRNTYLVLAFMIVLFGLYHAVPSQFVSISWLGAALFYFALSIVLHNIKYRWMAIFTIFAMIFHIFIIDMSKVDAVYRIVLFLVVGLVLLGVSLLYGKYKTAS